MDPERTVVVQNPDPDDDLQLGVPIDPIPLWETKLLSEMADNQNRMSELRQTIHSYYARIFEVDDERWALMQQRITQMSEERRHREEMNTEMQRILMLRRRLRDTQNETMPFLTATVDRPRLNVFRANTPQ